MSWPPAANKKAPPRGRKMEAMRNREGLGLLLLVLAVLALGWLASLGGGEGFDASGYPVP